MGISVEGVLEVSEAASAPANPASGSRLIYPKSDGKWYTKDSAGVETFVLMDADLKGGAASFKDRIAVISNFASPNVGGVVSSYYYDNNPHAGVGTLAGAANRCDLAPFYISGGLAIDQLGVSVSTAVAGSQMKVVIYGSDANGWPSAKLYETAALSGAATGYVSESLSFTFASGTQYWLGVRHSSTATLRTIAINSAWNLGLGSSGNTGTQCTVIRRTITFANAAPDPWGFVNTELTSNVTPPSIRFRAV